jgi:hypothetical protein
MIDVLIRAAIAGAIGGLVARAVTAQRTPAGWFGDPWCEHELRWWNGSAWTSYTWPPPTDHL